MSDGVPELPQPQVGPPPPVLPPGAFFDGVLVLRDPGRIDGRVRGEILAASDIWVGPDGFVEADLEGGTIVIEGQVLGDVRARRLIELRSTGRVRGRLTAPRLRVADGCIVDGPCRAGGAEGAGAPDARAAPGREPGTAGAAGVAGEAPPAAAAGGAGRRVEEPARGRSEGPASA